MQTFETKLAEVKYNYKTFCDWCGTQITGGRSINWDYNKDDFTLSWEWGDSYPEGGSGEEINVDLCLSCRNKLFSWLKSQGCKVEIKEWDY